MGLAVGRSPAVAELAVRGERGQDGVSIRAAVLFVMMSAKDAAILRIQGTSKLHTTVIFVLQQGITVLAGPSQMSARRSVSRVP